MKWSEFTKVPIICWMFGVPMVLCHGVCVRACVVTIHSEQLKHAVRIWVDVFFPWSPFFMRSWSNFTNKRTVRFGIALYTVLLLKLAMLEWKVSTDNSCRITNWICDHNQPFIWARVLGLQLTTNSVIVLQYLTVYTRLVACFGNSTVYMYVWCAMQVTVHLHWLPR